MVRGCSLKMQKIIEVYKMDDLGYYIEPKLLEKIQFMKRRRAKNFDHLLLVEGGEGLGKTNFAVHYGYACAKEFGCSFGNENIFFDPDEMMDFAVRTEAQVIQWDEAAMAALGSNWQSKVQQKLIKCMMMARKKRHTWIFLIPYIETLKLYFLKRAVGLVHVYSRDDLERGRYVYVGKKKIKAVIKKIRMRQEINWKFYDFRGSCQFVLPKLIDEQEYEKKKDEVILDVFGEDGGTNPWKTRYDDFKRKFGAACLVLNESYGLTVRDIADRTDTSRNFISLCMKESRESMNLLRIKGFVPVTEQKITKLGDTHHQENE